MTIFWIRLWQEWLASKASMLSRIADHNALKIELSLAEVTATWMSRMISFLQGANWKLLDCILSFRRDLAEDALLFVLQIFQAILIKHILRRDVKCSTSKHACLNSCCRAAVIVKNNVWGRDDFQSVQERCSEYSVKNVWNILQFTGEVCRPCSRQFAVKTN